MITKTKTTEYKLKSCMVEGSHVIDEDGETVNLMDDIMSLFETEEFDIVVKSVRREKLEVKKGDNDD